MYILTHYFEVVWQLGSTSVAWVHGDTDITVGIEVELCALKNKSVYMALHSSDDAQNL